MQNKYRWLILLAISIMVFLINVDYSAVNLALATISQDFQVSLSQVQWVLGGYIIAWAAVVVPAGKYGDKLGHQKVCLIGMLLFIVASVLAGLAVSANMLIFARILQGISGAIYVPALYALIFQNFPENERGFAIGLMSIGIGLGAAIGPSFGGALLTYASWRAIFYINIPLTLFALAILYRNKSVQPPVNPTQKVNKVSAALLSFSLIAVMYVISQWHVWGIHAVLFKAMIAAAVVMLMIFVVLQKQLKEPLLPLNLFKNKSFLGCSIGFSLEQYAFAAISIGMVLYLQKVMHYSTLVASVAFLPMTILFAIVAVFGGRWNDRVGFKKPAIVGLLLMIVGTAILIFYLGHSIWQIEILLSVIGIGMGLAFAALNAGLVKTVEASHIGIASSVFAMICLLGNSLGVALTVLIFEKSSQADLMRWINEHFSKVTAEQGHQLIDYIANIGVVAPRLTNFTALVQDKIIQHTPAALNHGVASVMVAAIVSLLLATVCAWGLIQRKQ